MKTTAAYPRNKAHFLRLIRFGKEIIVLCHSLGVRPILYGSMAYFLHTGDGGMNVNDLDILVPIRKIDIIAGALKRRGIRHKVFPQHDSITVTRGDLRIELDAMETTYKDTVWRRRLPKDFVDLSIDDVKLRMIGLKGMKRVYGIAYARSKEDKKRIKEKIRGLEALMRKESMEKAKSDQDHRSLALWAADCAEHVLPYFEKEYPKDDRPRKAIETARDWAHGDMPMRISVIRAAALAAHAAARDTDDPAARAAARAAGQAVAVVHVAGHFSAAIDYAVKSAEAAGVAGEREWQYKRLPKGLRPVVERMKVRKQKAKRR